MAPSDIVLVHGFWEGPGIWRLVAPALEKRGYKVTNIKLPGTGTPASESPKSPSMYDDIEVIRKTVTDIVDAGRDVILVGHSGGGFLAAHAVRELTPNARKKAGKSGAVVKFAFVTAALFPPGHQHGPSPFMDVQGDKMFCKTPRNLLFNDIADDAEAQAEVDKLTFQPGFGWDGEIEYAGWLEIPSAYLICEKDAAIPPAFQRQIADGAKCDPIQSCDGGHSAPITQYQAVADFLAQVAEGA